MNLPNLTLLTVSGEDRVSFLQGQLTQDVSQLGEQRPALLAASCDAKGRVLAVITLIARPESIDILIREDLADAWVSQIMRFRLRARVEIVPQTLAVVTAAEEDGDGYQLTTGAGNASANRWRVGTWVESYVENDDCDLATTDPLLWRQARLRAGIPDFGPVSSGKFTPHMLGLQDRSAISFNKGCYTGQEVVARTHHLGVAKRGPQLLQLAALGDADCGDEVFAGDRKCGSIAAISGDLAFAVIQSDAGDALQTANGEVLSRVPFDSV
ncbi:MAG: hypothetical protein AAF290_04265 [Pseudomonadota bacterium]